MTTSGTRVDWPAYQRLAERSLVTRDESHPLHAGQSVTLTDAGRTCLTGSRRTTATRTTATRTTATRTTATRAAPAAAVPAAGARPAGPRR